MRAVQFNLLALSLASPIALAMPQMNLTQGVTPTSHDIFNLHMTVIWVCIVIGFIVFVPMFYSIIFHRKSLGVQPAQFHEHLWLEITWTLIPFVIITGLAIPGTMVLRRINIPEKPYVTIKITGYQWKWKYEYLNEGISFFSNISTPFEQQNGKAPKGIHYLREVDKPLVLPIHKNILFLITSNDVIHAWWVPDFGVKRDAVPGFITENWTFINRPGTYRGQCAELCGLNHALMPIVVNAVSESDYKKWLFIQKGGTLPPPTTEIKQETTTTVQTVPVKLTKDELMKKGEQLYSTTCAACHKPDGTGMPPVYPSLKGSAIAKGPLDAHLHIVLFGKPGTAMQSFKDQFSDEELAALVTYERNAWENNTGDVVTVEQVKAIKSKP